MDDEELALFQNRIDYSFREQKKLKRALFHSSLRGEGIEYSNERLEFLGDAVLGFCVADEIFHLWPDDDEDELTRKHHALTCSENLAEIGREFMIWKVLKVGDSLKGQELSESIIGNAMEAIIGAVFDDGGMQTVRLFIDHIFFDSKRLEKGLSRRDWITEVKELFDKNGMRYAPRIETKIVDGKKIFFAYLEFQGKGAIGKGKSKKEAEREASRILRSRSPEEDSH